MNPIGYTQKIAFIFFESEQIGLWASIRQERKCNLTSYIDLIPLDKSIPDDHSCLWPKIFKP